MKINSSILAAALGLASVSLASATQTVFITGSTAARDAIYNTLISGTDGGFDAVPEFVGYGSTTPGNCSFMAFSNTISGTPTIVYAHWSGSEAGINDVSQGASQEKFMNAPGTGGIPAFTSTPNGITGSPANSDQQSAFADFAQADNDLPYSKIPNSTGVSSYDSLVIPFVFVKTTNSITDSTAFTDVTSDNFKALAGGGDKLALFTGNSADVHNYVFLAGRDDNSGTRVNAFGDTGWGIKKAPKQIELGANGAMVNFGTALAPVYTTAEGQSSGGTLATSLTNTTSAVDAIHSLTGFIAVAYLGLSDDATAEAAPYNAVRLSYNGVPYSFANVENGTYAFWGYEFTVETAANFGSGNAADTVASAVINNVENHTAGFEIPDASMNATRSGPTGSPAHN
jgi:hypothetical protein